MNFLKKNWFWIVLILLLLYAISTANRVLTFVIAGAATFYLWLSKITNPIYWALAVLGWLLGLLWGSIAPYITPQPNNNNTTFPDVTGSTGGAGGSQG